MEQINQDTPSKIHKCDSPLINNPWVNRTPVKQNETRLKRTTCRNNVQCLPFTVLPSHITPPSKLNKFIIKNPFEPDLTNRLHLPVISPTVFTKVSNSMQRSPDFTWNIDELARIQPATIEEFPKQQQVCSLDPELEIKAQAAIDRFFTENLIIPSPWDVRQKKNKSYVPFGTPNRLLDDLNSTKELSKPTKDVWSQTVLSLPLDLPQNVEEALKPFFTFTQEQNADSDDINLSNNSLRRKLFFNHDECTDNDHDSIVSLSPVKMSESMILSCSPPQSGMFAHDTPLKRLLQARRESDETSVVKFKNLSPPNMSPIYNIKNDISYERVGHCSHSATRLDLAMDMNVDNIAVEKNQNLVNGYHSLDAFLGKDNANCTEDNNKLIIVENDKTNVYDSFHMKKILKCKNLAGNIVHSDAVVFNDKGYNGTNVKIATKMESFVHESHKQSNMMSGASDQQSISNSVQDTGYQTYSMNSTMHTVDSCNNMSANYKTHWNEQIVTLSKDNDQLSWRENMRNVFSSTPSRCNKKDERERDCVYVE